MISIRCPHCHVGLKVDEGKLPPGILSFKCPKCKKSIPISLLKENNMTDDSSSDTTLLQTSKSTLGQITVLADEHTREQVFPLYEGVSLIGRKSSASNATIGIVTDDRSMSREHIRIEVKKEAKGGYKHYLSDNNSKNHTLYNSSFLEKGEVIVLKDNDEIIIGRTVLRFND
ncbi:putative Zn finger-like uncharacterized protein [Parabacteroides sp. PFB2-10]|nr:putative Zn finger-like uncharacterized protein [Parabacteroides sp. PFB2-10]